ncbi:MAG: nucleotidyltransferase domain-containing protein [Candidatus Aenigmatarchaeota archaeon]
MIQKNIKRRRDRKQDIKEAIKEFFFLNPTSKMRVRQVEKELKLPLPSVIKYCRELKNEGILTIAKIGNVVFYTADRSSQRFILEKRLFTIRRVYDSGLIDYLKEELSNPVVVLFGSCSRGEDTEKSDMDIYIETKSKKEINLEKFEKNLQRKIQVFRHSSFKEVKNTFLANSIINGIVLNGFLEVLK